MSLAHSFKQRLSKLESRIKVDDKADVQIDSEKCELLLCNTAREDGSAHKYIPTQTGLAFHQSNAMVKGILGPYGSGKTTASLAEIIFQASQMPRLDDGSRKARWAIIRNTYGDLQTTTYVSWQAWYERLGIQRSYQKPNLTVTHTFSDGDGIIELELLFLALDKEGDIRKLKSLEICGAYINEASEIPYVVLEHLKGRVGRYLMNLLPSYRKSIILDTNAPHEKHWIKELFDEQKPANHALFKQPPGLIKDAEDVWTFNPASDNFERLGRHYYVDMANGASQEFIKVYCLGKYGTVLSGKKVFPEFNDDLHSTAGLKFNPDYTIGVGIDLGLTPCAIFVQQNSFGQIEIVKALTTTRMGLRQFVEFVLLPFLTTDLDGYNISYFVCDPAGRKTDEYDDTQTAFDVFDEFGLQVEAAPTNNLLPRLEVVRFYLNRLIDGKPAILVDKHAARVLRDGFLGGYHYKKLNVVGAEKYRDEPEKNDFSHPMDALQYILMRMTDPKYFNADKKPRVDLEKLRGVSLRF